MHFGRMTSDRVAITALRKRRPAHSVESRVLGLPIALMMVGLLLPGPVTAQTFTLANSPDITASVGFPFGATWVDFDEDGDLDLYVVKGFDANPNNILYRNDAGVFVAVTGMPLVTDQADTPCSAWADFDNDGHVDVFVSNLGVSNGTLYAGHGGGTYAPVTGALPAVLKGAGCAWGDYDNDGRVDLVVASIYGQLGMNTPSRLFHNDGIGVFSEVTTGPIATTLDSHHFPIWSDFDGDGDLDLFFATGPVGSLDTDRMYRNRLAETGFATFEPITSGLFATDPRDSQTLQWIDFDNDGDFDFFAVNYTSVPCQLYRNDGGGSWTRLTSGSLVTDLGHAHGAVWGDFDNDGDLDVYVVTDLSESNRYYRNDGGDAFTRITAGAFVNEARSNYGAAAGDYDGDGDLDLFVPTARSEGPSALYRNDTGNGNHWLEVSLQGVASNRSGIGAKVRVKAVIAGAPRWQLREVRSGTSYGGHDALDVHVGLGAAAIVDSLVIEWPSGIRQVLMQVAVDRRMAIAEDVTTAVAVSLISARVESDRVEIGWHVALPGGTIVEVERRDVTGPWRTIAEVFVDGAGRVDAIDTHIEADASYLYRLAFRDGMARVYGEPVEVQVPPRSAFALAVVGPGNGALRARVQVPSDGDVTLEVFDLGGRLCVQLRPTLEKGWHELTLAPAGELRQGIYFVRLLHAGGQLNSRALILR
jgi:enediyne biosynthesis protein E4